MKRLVALSAVFVVLVSACSPADERARGEGTSSAASSTGSTTSSLDAPPSSDVSPLPELDDFSALDLFAGGNRGGEYPATLPQPTIDTAALLRGQVPDGIPAIDDARFVSVAEADEYLEGNEAVVVLDIEGDARAYPVQILIWHEIVNDVVGGVPVSITYCPLCNSAVSYERIVQGETTTFGTSGLLFNSALVMYDRLTESLWTHYNGEAIAGLATSERLRAISSPLLGWAEFKEAFPDGVVLDRNNTGYSRAYGANPYVDYDNPSRFPFLFQGELDDQIGAQRRVAGVSIDGAAKAWTLEAISGGASRATHDMVGEQSVVVFWKSGQATALESDRIDGGRDVGSVGVFLSEAGGQTLTFAGQGEAFVDEQTNSTWNVFGHAIDGPLAGANLTEVPHLDTFWFAWFSYNPGTDLIDG